MVDVLRTLLSAWRWWGGCSLMVLALAGAYLAVTPSEYEAVCLVLIGQQGQIGKMDSSLSVEISALEAPGRAIERLKADTFQKGVIERLGWSGDAARSALYRGSMKATPKGDLVQLSIRGRTGSDALEALEATVAHLADSHRELAHASIGGIQAVATSLATQLEVETAVLDNISRMLRDLPASSHLERIEGLKLVAQQQRYLNETKNKQMTLRLAVTAFEKTPTAMLAPATISAEPVFPKARSVLVWAALGGILIGILAAMMFSPEHAEAVTRDGSNPTPELMR